MKTPASAYEDRYPQTGIGDAQKQERGERLALKVGRQTNRRTSSIVVPELPWLKEKTDDR